MPSDTEHLFDELADLASVIAASSSLTGWFSILVASSRKWSRGWRWVVRIRSWSETSPSWQIPEFSALWRRLSESAGSVQDGL